MLGDEETYSIWSKILYKKWIPVLSEPSACGRQLLEQKLMLGKVDCFSGPVRGQTVRIRSMQCFGKSCFRSGIIRIHAYGGIGRRGQMARKSSVLVRIMLGSISNTDRLTAAA